jgi:hypothetical protein
MKKLWQEEIDAELRVLEDYVLNLEPAAEVDYGRNLIADALGPGATYEQFSPVPTLHHESTVRDPQLQSQETLAHSKVDDDAASREQQDTRILKGTT